MRFFKSTVTAVVIAAATASIVVSTGATANADGGPTPSNWHCC